MFVYKLYGGAKLVQLLTPLKIPKRCQTTSMPIRNTQKVALLLPVKMFGQSKATGQEFISERRPLSISLWRGSVGIDYLQPGCDNENYYTFDIKPAITFLLDRELYVQKFLNFGTRSKLYPVEDRSRVTSLQREGTMGYMATGIGATETLVEFSTYKPMFIDSVMLLMEMCREKKEIESHFVEANKPDLLPSWVY
nr:rust resistance kinase Lr10-like [Ipomoea batatas]